jgi:hypothetical protein
MAKQLIMRILGAAITLIVLSFAPSVALAHSGHQHHAAVHAGHGHTAVHDTASGKAHAPASLYQAQVQENGALPASDRNCVGDCCGFACAACCAAGLPSPVSFTPFPPTATRVAMTPSFMRPDRGPESLRRPPKTFI